MSLLSGRLPSVFTSGQWSVAGLCLLLFLSVIGYLATDELFFLGAPIILLFAAAGINNFRFLYLCLWATIPFAIEIDLPGGLSTDFPAEPLMWVCTVFVVGYLILKSREINFSFVYHPIFIALLIHFFWIILTTITSQQVLLSIKFTLAKSWYLVCFVLIPILLLRSPSDFRKWGIYLFIPLTLSVLVVIIRHAFLGFTFSSINQAIMPIYRNHVDYACALAILLPFAWWLRKNAIRPRIRNLYTIVIIILLIGIYFSYTRAAWLCIPLAAGCYWLVQKKLLRAVIPVAVAIALLIISWLANDNTYIDFSPNYEKAITHGKFDDLVSATYRMEDVSTVERFYRWVAGYYMIKERPLMGYGPTSFYDTYHSYVDRHFTTYVSDNPEHSGIHNYYLMTAVEQGLIGLLIFIGLLCVVIFAGESLYHRLPSGPQQQLVMASIISFCCSLFILTLNDTVETDKLGTVFFLCMAVLIQMDRQSKSTDTATEKS